MRLHGIGYAQLENEREVEAESTYRELIDLVPDEPLGHANLAVALLRQDRKDEALAAIDRALELDGHRADLLLIRADILQWSGRNDDALVDYRRAARAAPDDPETQYALFRLAEIMDGAQAEADRRDAVERLRGLRPDNLVVLLLSGEAALEDGDRGRASDDYLRVRELIWQAQPAAERVVEEVLDALEADDLESARRMAPRVTNVMKGTAGWRSSQPEVFTNVQGIPVERFVDESPIEDFGPALPVRFRATRIDNSAAAGRALEVADFDGDDRPDIAWVAAGDDSETPLAQLQLRRASAGLAAPGTAPETAALLLVAGDADNDRRLDLVAVGDPLAVWQVDASGDTHPVRGLQRPFPGAALRRASAADLIDFDSDGDLDLAVARTGGGPDLLRNVSGEGVFRGPPRGAGRQERCRRSNRGGFTTFRPPTPTATAIRISCWPTTPASSGWTTSARDGSRRERLPHPPAACWEGSSAGCSATTPSQRSRPERRYGSSAPPTSTATAFPSSCSPALRRPS